jgi:2-polyprenyl-3-methyl-5-hydroxy-6-metoxy-1,4-benzoquinol methylase
MNCILCQSTEAAAFRVDKKPEHSYYHCGQCDLIFLNPVERLTEEQEKARYDLHTDADSQGHQAFLAPLVGDVQELIAQSRWNPSDVQVLDYGCGPTAFLSALFDLKGIATTNYDIFYRPDQAALRKTYHVVTSTEVWEHFYFPYSEINQLVSMIKPNGYLAVMTSGHKGEAAFHDWYYRRDATHVSFYSEKTMQWIASRWGLRLIKAKSPYWIFQK